MATHGVTVEQAEAIGRVRLPEGHGPLGETASRMILAELKKDVVTYDKAVETALGKSHSDFRTGEILDQLPYYGEILSREIPPGTLNPDDIDEVRWGKITNPTVHIGLGQLRRLLNAIIKVHGRPDEIVVELARELKLNEKQKDEHNKRINKDTRAAKARSDELLRLGQPDSGEIPRAWELRADNNYAAGPSRSIAALRRLNGPGAVLQAGDDKLVMSLMRTTSLPTQKQLRVWLSVTLREGRARCLADRRYRLRLHPGPYAAWDWRPYHTASWRSLRCCTAGSDRPLARDRILWCAQLLSSSASPDARRP